MRKGCIEAYDLRTILDLLDSWLHLCVAFLQVRDIVNTMHKRHKYRIDLHEAFECAITESPKTMGRCCNQPRWYLIPSAQELPMGCW